MTEEQFKEITTKLSVIVFYAILITFILLGNFLIIGIHQNEQINLLQGIATSVAPSK